ncbi:HlyD family secretion protein [Anaerospora sp.]|uniref:HlyD family secretion protein n=1 Tax=Anaerospora sp. TaxID=1960278 RepID=UPI00289A34ED|nr:HlyD family secretion protein [Anaerospora sp.]
MEQKQTPNGKKPKVVMLLLAIFLAAGVIAGGGWWYYSTKYVSTDDARIGGTIVTASAKIPGRIVEVLVKEGDSVTYGQLVARIETREIVAQKVQAEAALATAKARYEEIIAGARPQEIDQARSALDQAKASLDHAAKNYERMEKLYHDGAISSSQRDSADTTFVIARETYKSAGEKLDLVLAGSRDETVRAAAAQVRQAEATLEAAQATYDNATITAPVSGLVALKSVNPGEVVAAGQALFTIADLQDVWVSARIEETKIGKLKPGQQVEYTVDGYPGRTFTGTVYEIGAAANSVFALIPTENSSGNFTKVTQRIPIKISLPKDSDVVFRPGMSVIIKVHIG